MASSNEFGVKNNFIAVNYLVYTNTVIGNIMESYPDVWGVCDEDLYEKAIKVMNNEAKENKPFFNHIMTVSNHRPYTWIAKF